LHCWLSYLIRFFFSSRRRHTRSKRDWSSDVCSSDLKPSPPQRVTERLESRRRSRSLRSRSRPTKPVLGRGRLFRAGELSDAMAFTCCQGLLGVLTGDGNGQGQTWSRDVLPGVCLSGCTRTVQVLPSNHSGSSLFNEVRSNRSVALWTRWRVCGRCLRCVGPRWPGGSSIARRFPGWTVLARRARRSPAPEGCGVV